jgi:hypothetical protein
MMFGVPFVSVPGEFMNLRIGSFVNFSNRFDEEEKVHSVLFISAESTSRCAQCSVKIISEIFIFHCGSCGLCALFILT